MLGEWAKMDNPNYDSEIYKSMIYCAECEIRTQLKIIFAAKQRITKELSKIKRIEKQLSKKEQ